MVAQPRNEETARLERAKQLAEKLFFTLEQQGDRYSLFGTAGLSKAVRRENLTLDEVEQELELWKLKGFHGG